MNSALASRSAYFYPVLRIGPSAERLLGPCVRVGSTTHSSLRLVPLKPKGRAAERLGIQAT